MDIRDVLKIGDKIKYITEEDNYVFFTYNKEYEIIGFEDNFRSVTKCAIVMDDTGKNHYLTLNFILDNFYIILDYLQNNIKDMFEVGDKIRYINEDKCEFFTYNKEYKIIGFITDYAEEGEEDAIVIDDCEYRHYLSLEFIRNNFEKVM